MNKFMVLSTILGLLTFSSPSVEGSAHHRQTLSESTQMYMSLPIPAIIPICCPACRRPCGFMGLTSCKCYKDRMAAQELAEKEAAMKEAASKDAARGEKEASKAIAHK